MANISVTVSAINGNAFLTAKSMIINAANIKAVRQNLTGSTVSYYDEMSALMQELEVTDSVRTIWSAMGTPVLITAESWESELENKTMILEQLGYSMAPVLSKTDPLALAFFTITSSAGTYVTGDTIYKGAALATASATGRIIAFDKAANGTALMVIQPLKGLFAAADVVNSSGSATNDVIATYQAAPQKEIYYQWGQKISQKSKEIKAYVSATTGAGTSTAVTAISRTARTIQVAGDLRATFIKDAPFFVNASTDYDGLYTTVLSVFNSGTNRTTITVLQAIPGAASNGNVIY